MYYSINKHRCTEFHSVMDINLKTIFTTKADGNLIAIC